MMAACCIESIVAVGFATGFELAAEGDRHTCPECGAVYVLKNGKWERDVQEETPGS